MFFQTGPPAAGHSVGGLLFASAEMGFALVSARVGSLAGFLLSSLHWFVSPSHAFFMPSFFWGL